MRVPRTVFVLAFAIRVWFADRLRSLERILFTPRMREGGRRAQTDAKSVIAAGSATVASGGLIALIRQDLLGGWLYAIALQGVRTIQSLGGIGDVVGAFWSGLASLVESGIPNEIIDAGVATSAGAIRAQFGIAGFVIAILVTMTGIALFLWFLVNINFNPLGIFTGRGGD